MRSFDSAKQAKFLSCITLGMSVKAACEATGISRRTFYYEKAENPEFADFFLDAKAASVEELEDHLRQRATDPNDKASHLLLMFLLKKLDPTYKENYKTETKRAVTQAREFEFDPAEIDAALGILAAAKARKNPLNEE